MADGDAEIHTSVQISRILEMLQRGNSEEREQRYRDGHAQRGGMKGMVW